MIQEIKSKGFSNSPLQWIIYLLIFGLLATLFVQNFIYADSFEALSFRRIDDIAFQLVLKDMHQAMTELNFRGFLATNNYSYGWIYWFPLALLTFPFYLIDSSISEMAIIVIPREASLFWQIGTLLIVYKIMMYFTNNKDISLFAILSFILFPSFGFYSSVFGTPSQIQFFAALSIYLVLILEKTNFKSIVILGVVVSLAGATKITGVMVCAIVGLILLKKLNFKFNTHSIKIISLFVLISVISWWIFYNPFLVLSLFDTTIWNAFVSNFTYGFSTININVLETISIFEKFEQGIAGGTFHINTTLLLILLLLIEIFVRYKKDEDYTILTIIFLGLLIIISFLFINVKHGLSYIVNYFTAVNYLLLLGFIVFKRVDKKIFIPLMALIISLNFYFNFVNFNNSSFGYFSFFKSIEKTKKEQEIKKNIYSLLEKYNVDKNSQLNIIREYNAIELFSSMRSNIYQVISFVNFHITKNQLEYYDLISLNKSDTKIKVPHDIAELDYQEVKKLLETKRLKNVEYEVLFEDERYIVLISKDLINKGK